MNVHVHAEVRYAFAPPMPKTAAAAVVQGWWPISRLGEGVAALAARSGLARTPGEPLASPGYADWACDGFAERWFDWAGGRLGLEAEPIATPAAELEALLRRAGPAVVLHEAGHEPGFLLVLGARGDHVRLLAPDLQVKSVRIEPVRAALLWSIEAPLEPEIEQLIEAAAVSRSRRRRVRNALMNERLAGKRFEGAWMLRSPASTRLGRQLREAGVFTKAAGVIGLFAATYGLEMASWALLGGAALGGRLDFGWMAAWLLLLVSMVPLRFAAGWLEAGFALDAGRILKSRLLAGALGLDLEKVLRQGVGQLIGRVMETQALESLALSGGLSTLAAVVELGVAVLVLAKGISPFAHIGLLAGTLGVSGWLTWRYWRRLKAWSESRIGLTDELIEGMVGHRTRLAQERPGRRDAREDQSLEAYLAASKAMDRSGVVVLAALPSAWVLLGLIGVVPAFASGTAVSPVGLAISLGGLLLAQRALAGVSGGLASLTRAAIAWRQVADLVGGGERAQPKRPFLSPRDLRGAGRGAPLVAAEGLEFRYDPAGRAILGDVGFVIRRGERVLLEGASGGGKSTLAGLISGLRQPNAGLLLLNGLDRHTLGDDWRRLVSTAPQFNENHILSGSLAFNLLMGRRWPASAEDLAEAEALCVELGLKDLLARMPAGIHQRVGETGWQLSHGERSRIFLARALLQGAELTVLDESFAALDPENLELCLRATLKRARTMLVIAHP